jgi:hypothetical protein
VEAAAAVMAPPVEKAIRNASYSLVAFTFLTLVTLTAWFGRSPEPWGFASFVALLGALLGIGATVLFWRQPTREYALGGLAALAISLVRVGLPTSWTPTSFVLIAITAVLAVPLAQVVIVLPRS